VHLKRNLIKIGKFLCSYFNIEDGRKHFQHIVLISKKVKMQLKHKDLCSVWKKPNELSGQPNNWSKYYLLQPNLISKD